MSRLTDPARKTLTEQMQKFFTPPETSEGKAKLALHTVLVLPSFSITFKETDRSLALAYESTIENRKALHTFLNAYSAVVRTSSNEEYPGIHQMKKLAAEFFLPKNSGVHYVEVPKALQRLYEDDILRLGE